MDGYLFDPIELTDPKVREIMENNTCRQCANRITSNNGYSYCGRRNSGQTNNGHLRVRCNQPACILFTVKTN